MYYICIIVVNLYEIIMKNIDVKRERFEKVASKRTQLLLDTFDKLIKCSNRNNYEYSEEDIKKMFKTIKEKLKYVENAYLQELQKNIKNKFEF